VGPRERGPVGSDREPRTPTTHVRRAALEATGSPSHFHGQPRPPRTPPSLLSLQAGYSSFFCFFSFVRSVWLMGNEL
jgi:hypothetical protein